MNDRLQKISFSFLLSSCLVISFYVVSYGQAVPQEKMIQSSQTRVQLIKAFKKSLKEQLLDHWYPKVDDKKDGGYFSDMTRDWKLKGKQNKYIVTQARNVWVLSKTSTMFPKRKESYHKMAAHGVSFLENKMWDHKYGGFYSLVDRKGNVIRQKNNPWTGIKTLYGNVFAIYGLTEYYTVFHDKSALKFAIKTFRWLDNHAYDPQYGGFFEHLRRDGKPYVKKFGGQLPKGQNSSIHTLEALTSLYRAWPNDTLRTRLKQLLFLIRDKMTYRHHYLNLFFHRDWKPLNMRDSLKNGNLKYFPDDYISFGHNVETAYLMLDAAKALHFNPKVTLMDGKSMVDYAIKNGWDKKLGGMFDGGFNRTPNGPVSIVRPTKIWWTQAEVLNSFLLMAKYFPKDKRHYYQLFLKQWKYIQTYLIDHKYGGWYWEGIDQNPKRKFGPKATIWKATYHDSRALMNCIIRLQHMKLTPEEKHL